MRRFEKLPRTTSSQRRHLFFSWPDSSLNCSSNKTFTGHLMQCAPPPSSAHFNCRSTFARTFGAPSDEPTNRLLGSDEQSPTSRLANLDSLTMAPTCITLSDTLPSSHVSHVTHPRGRHCVVTLFFWYQAIVGTKLFTIFKLVSKPLFGINAFSTCSRTGA